MSFIRRYKKKIAAFVILALLPGLCACGTETVPTSAVVSSAAASRTVPPGTENVTSSTGATAAPAAESETEPVVRPAAAASGLVTVTDCRLDPENGLVLNYTVRTKTAEEPVLYIWCEENGKIGEKTEVLRPSGSGKAEGDHRDYSFRYEGLSAVRMTDQVYAAAQAGNEVSTVKKTSIVQCAHEMMDGADPAVQAMLTSLLAYGAAAQRYAIDTEGKIYQPNRPADGAFHFLYLGNALFEDGTASGFYAEGEELLITPIFSGNAVWMKNGVICSEEKVLSVTVGSGDDTYAAVEKNGCVVSLASAGAGRILCGGTARNYVNASEGSSIFAEGNKLTIDGELYTAEPSETYEFAEWRGIPESLDSDITVTAVFYSAEVFNYKTDAAAMTAEVSGLKAGCTDTMLRIPETVQIGEKEYRVTAVGPAAFKGNTVITDIEIGDGVERIGQEAFAGCSALKNVGIGKSTERIGASAFENCVRLSVLSGGEMLGTVGDRAFYGCRRLHRLESESLSFAGTDAFTDACSLTQLTVAADFTAGENAFAGCRTLRVICSDKPELAAGSTDCGGLAAYAWEIAKPGSAQPEDIGSFTFYRGGETPVMICYLGSSSIPVLPDIGDSYTVGESAFYAAASLKGLVFGPAVSGFGPGCFAPETLQTVYFKGTAEEWAALDKGGNTALEKQVLFYSESARSGCWHFDEKGKPSVW